tara:strand:+ start:775087 stop:776994 length:1908 start_codon:yes stop_codon:yes gene_type:complete
MYSQDKPNIVLIFPDNLGVGEVSTYGSARGIETPNIDRIGNEGIKLNNFNVEYSCAVSRIAILTGRYAVRTGKGDARNGMTLWENTIAEDLKTAGYATALYGKWHIGGENWEGQREPTHQGFDEWWGIPNTSHIAQYTSFEGFDPDRSETPYIWEGKAGEAGKKVKPYNMETRRTIDREAAIKGVEFMKKNAKKKKPFFLYYPMTQIHFPTLTHPDKAGSTGAGDIADAMADVDYNVGLILEELKRLGIEENTLVIWCTDNGAEMRRPWRGSAGPWRGYYNSHMEGGIRTPFVAKWPKRIKPGQVSNQIVHEIDVFPTLMAAAGVTNYMPNDRIFDGVNQLPFLEGKQKKSNRESITFVAREGNMIAVKWHNWKLWYYFRTPLDPEPTNLVRLFDLNVDPREEIDVKDFYPWVIPIMDSIVADYEASLITFPRVPSYINDPYTPPKRNTGSPVATYSRTDRADLNNRSEALPAPNFSGTWTTSMSKMPSIKKGPTPELIPTLGSGWGDEISMIHSDNQLEVERILFETKDIQPPFRYRYALDGSETKHKLPMGRTWPEPVSTTKWDGNRLVITTNYPFKNPQNGVWMTGKTIQTLWMQYAKASPWEHSLVVETTRVGILGGISSTNRTVYYKGYY